MQWGDIKELPVSFKYHKICWFVDTFYLWNHIRQLNSVFTDSNILKVVHGGESDAVWL